MRRGFTLVELLVVIFIMAILMVIVSTGLQAVLGTGFGSEATDLASTLVRARAHAMANNTYVFVGIAEVDASTSSSAAQTAGSGRVGVAVVASNDGTRIYSSASAGAITPATTLTVVSPLRRFENVHLLGASLIAPAKLPMSGGETPDNVYASPSGTTFSWPLSGTAQYNFGPTPGSIIQFNPQGEAQIIPTGRDTTGNAVLKWIELDLEPSHGNAVTPSTNGATILIDGASGSVTLYRT